MGDLGVTPDWAFGIRVRRMPQTRDGRQRESGGFHSVVPREVCLPVAEKGGIHCWRPEKRPVGWTQLAVAVAVVEWRRTQQRHVHVTNASRLVDSSLQAEVLRH